ncbi:hypothetical protein L3476_07705 [Paenibacillus thiaminolyticus]|uniref:hypothetical protein n=1 Tax=Paenibacillus thiaminolyticus TaxID=49283 RepID=UPI0023503413|nr:hypothetical protein [Paenibacillus thiaminolyticus]WCR28612.1 hypothetical protein L3476_07705 [Paenibacillus thiaminolyticus]
MLVNVNRYMLERLDDWALASACYEPLILAYKAASAQGGDGRQIFSEMTAAQQALFIFRVYHDHVRHSAEELYWWSAYFVAEAGRWAALIGSLRQSDDRHLLPLLQEIDILLTERQHPRPLDHFEVSRHDLEDDKELSSLFGLLYGRYEAAASYTVARIAGQIRLHPEQYGFTLDGDDSSS